MAQDTLLGLACDVTGQVTRTAGCVWMASTRHSLLGLPMFRFSPTTLGVQKSVLRCSSGVTEMAAGMT